MTEIIPFHRPYPLSEAELRYIQTETRKIIKSGQLSKNGKYVQELEERIKEMYNVEYVLTTSNCTMGLMIALEFIDKMYFIQVPMFEWWSVLYALNFLKKSIAWNDIDLKTWLPIESYGGHSLYINTFGNMGKSTQDDTIYDSSHCLGATIPDMGLCHVFSLAPTKLITSCEGGIIITNNEEFYKFAKERRDKMARMSEIHAMIGNVYLEHLDGILYWKKFVHDYYKDHIPGEFQEIPDNSTYNTIGFLNTHNLIIPEEIEYKQYYDPIINLGPDVNKNAIYIQEKIICLPSYYSCPYEKIVEKIREKNRL